MTSSAAAASRVSSRALFGVLALAAMCFSGTADAQTINRDDCAALLSWSPYAAIATVPSCSPLSDCGDFYGVSCSDNGRVTSLNLSPGMFSIDRLSGTLPKEWSAMTALRRLYLDDNSLSGTLPTEWSAMTVLSDLYLYDNRLSGTLPTEWSAMTSLHSLYLRNNSLIGTLPKEWSAMASLWTLDLSNNSLSGTLPKEWSAMTGLNTMSLSNNNLSGTLPKEWSAVTFLYNLYLDNNSLSGTLPNEWSAMAYLRTLDLSVNPGLRIRSWPEFPALQVMNVSNTSADAASLIRWIQSYFCTLEYPQSIRMPDGEEVQCVQHRVTATVVICSVVVSMLLLVTVLRCCDGWRACCMLCKPNHSSGGWMDWVSSQWGRSEGAREWLLPQWTLFVASLDVASDIWVLVQVAPTRGMGLVSPFAVLLGGLFIPDLVASTLACWTWVSHRHPSSSDRALLTAAWFLPFTAWLHINIIKHFLVKILGACPSSTAKESTTVRSHEGSVTATLSQVVDPMKYLAFRSTLMAVTEDPISMAVTSFFYLVNKQELGQVLATPAYCISMLLSGMHVATEAWEHFPLMRQGLGGCLTGVCNLQPEGKEADNERPVLPVAGATQSVELTV